MVAEPMKSLDQLAREFYENYVTPTGGGGGGTVALDAPTLAALETISVANFPATFEIANDIGNPIPATDIYTGGQVLADQSPGGAVATFTFSSPVHLVWVKPTNGPCRVDPFGGTPTGSTGIPCDDGVPNPLTVLTSSVKVFATGGINVSVWGYRY